jgi:hypothetical protein
MTSFFRIVDKRAIYRWYNLIRTCVGKYDWLFHWQHKLSATLSANVNLNYHVPIKIYYRICTFRHIRIEPPLTSNNWTQKKTTTYGVGSNLDPSLGKAPKCVSIQHYGIKFVSDLRQVGGFLCVLRFLQRHVAATWKVWSFSYYNPTTPIRRHRIYDTLVFAGKLYGLKSWNRRQYSDNTI